MSCTMQTARIATSESEKKPTPTSLREATGHRATTSASHEYVESKTSRAGKLFPKSSRETCRWESLGRLRSVLRLRPSVKPTAAKKHTLIATADRKRLEASEMTMAAAATAVTTQNVPKKVNGSQSLNAAVSGLNW